MQFKQKIISLLRRSERYTQTDMVYLTKGGFWLSMGQAVSFLANFLLTMAFANWVSKETFGTYKYVLSLFGILSIPSLSGLNTAVITSTAKNEDGSFKKSLTMKMKWGILGTLASLAVAGYYFFRGNPVLSVCFLIVAVFLPFFNGFSLYESFLAGKKKFDLQNKFFIIGQIVSLAFLSAALFFSKNIFLILLAYFLPWTLLYLCFLLLTLKKFKPQGKADKKTISFGKHLSLMNVLSAVNSQLDRILLWHFLGPASLAIYSVSMMMPDRIKEALKTIGSLALPKLSARTSEELKKSLPKKTLRLFYLAIPAMLVYILIAPFVFKWFFPQYYQYVLYSQIYALILLTYPRILAGTALTAHKKTKELYIGSLVLSPIYWILLLSLLPAFGIWGAIIAFLVLEGITFALQYLQFKRM